MITNDNQRKINFISSFYSQIDEKVKEFENCCQKGCSYCCHQSIEVFSMERVLIGKFIKDSSITSGTRFYLLDITTGTLKQVKIGAEGTGPGGSGKALFVD